VDEDIAREAFEEAMRTHRPDFGTFFLAKLFGLKISYTDETCVVEVPIRDFMFNPQGSLHGGVIAFALDVSMGHLLKRTMGRPGITLEMKTQYLRPALSGTVRCEGRFLRRGRSINYLESRMTDEEGKLLAMATSTWQLLAEKSA
jgi:acyl-CoA thioesterase